MVQWNSKDLLKEFIVKTLLTEATCPLCGSEGAYVGLHDVECSNPRCKNFSERQKQDGKKKNVSNVKRAYWLDRADESTADKLTWDEVQAVWPANVIADFKKKVIEDYEMDPNEFMFAYAPVERDIERDDLGSTVWIDGNGIASEPPASEEESDDPYYQAYNEDVDELFHFNDHGAGGWIVWLD